MSHPDSRVTLSTVAQAAGVSLSTASAALSGTGRVGADTATRVHAVARELGYRLNPSARQLRSTGHPVVGVVVDTAGMNLDSNAAPAMWWPRAVFSLVDALAEHGIGVHLISAKTENDWPSVAIDALITIERPGGHSVVPHGVPYGIPIFFGGDIHHDDRSTAQIAPDFTSVATLALEHLATGGATRPGLMSIAARVSFAEHLESAYQQWCVAVGAEPLIVGRNGGAPELLIDELLAQGCDAIFSISNASAEILHALQARVAVPREFQLIVLSEGLIESHLRPRVSVVSLDGSTAGRTVAAHVAHAISTGEVSNVEVAARLILGDTTTHAG